MIERESVIEKLLHTALSLRDQAAGQAMTGEKQAFAREMLLELESTFAARSAEIQSIRSHLPRRDDAHGRAVALYVDELLERPDFTK